MSLSHVCHALQASKASRAQAVRPSTAGGIVKSAAARIAAFLPASNASGNSPLDSFCETHTGDLAVT